jgi:hypothetical protein
MRKTIFKVAVVGFAVLDLFAARVWIGRDKTPPSITFDKKKEYKQDMTEKELLEGVTAWDEKDGDVTDSLKIEFLVSNTDENTVVVTYVARDKSNNITKENLVLNYQEE